MTGNNFDAAIYAIRITDRTLIIGNVVSHWVYCAQTGEKNCTLGFKLKTRKKPLLMQNPSLLMKMGILTCEWEGKYVFTCAKK